MKLYAILDTNEMPSIKPEAPYLILSDGTIILQGFGIIAKMKNVEEAEDFCKNSKSFIKWDNHITEKLAMENFERFMQSCKERKL